MRYERIGNQNLTKGDSFMQISSRFTIGVHILLCIAYFKNEKTTSAFIAESVKVNPVVIRRTLGMLKAAGLVKVEAGVGGAALTKDPSEITLLDVFDAVDAVDDQLFSFHEQPNPSCPVGRNIHAVLDEKLVSAQNAMRADLAKTTIAELLRGIK